MVTKVSGHLGGGICSITEARTQREHAYVHRMLHPDPQPIVTVPLTPRAVDLDPFINPFWRHPHRHSKVCFMNSLGVSESSQVDNQNRKSL